MNFCHSCVIWAYTAVKGNQTRTDKSV